jgi:ribosomal protein S27AE
MTTVVSAFAPLYHTGWFSPGSDVRSIMRNSKACPKCKATDIVRIPGVVGNYGAGNNIFIGRILFSAVKVTRYLCGSCGFSEEWVDSADDIARVKKRYA